MKNYLTNNALSWEIQYLVGDKVFAEIVGDFCHITCIKKIPGIVYAEMMDALDCLKWQIHIDTCTNKWRIRADRHLAEWSEWKDF